MPKPRFVRVIGAAIGLGHAAGSFATNYRSGLSHDRAGRLRALWHDASPHNAGLSWAHLLWPGVERVPAPRA